MLWLINSSKSSSNPVLLLRSHWYLWALHCQIPLECPYSKQLYVSVGIKSMILPPSSKARENYTLSSFQRMAGDAQAFLKLIYQQLLQHRVFRLSFAVLALIVTAMSSEYLHQQWASNAFSWKLAESTYMLAYVSFVSFVVLTGLSQVNKSLLPRFANAQAMDFYLTWCSLLLRTLGSVALGLSKTPCSFVASLTLYTSSIGLYESVRALLPSSARPNHTFSS